ncbi:MAG: ORF6N domain-containing protein, partial [Candidatus Moranbacteria bacterium]|nr:ORF6N domain-containing protein [Candidatus Moranbacteria bacterium]
SSFLGRSIIGAINAHCSLVVSIAQFLFCLCYELYQRILRYALTKEEEEAWKSLSSQNVILSKKRGQHSKYLPYVFTEQGIAMLSSVLKSKTAIQVNIQIMWTFTKIREMIVSNKNLREKIEAMEKKIRRPIQSYFFGY